MRLFLLTLLCFPFLTSLFGTVNANGDFQIWASEFSVHSINNKTNFTVYNDFRFGNDAKELYVYQARFQYRHSPTSWLTLAPSYRQFFVKSPTRNGDKWHPSFNPLFEITFFLKRKWIEVSQRNWGLYFINTPPLTRNLWQYRNRLLFLTPWNFTKLQISPVLSEEVFFTEHRGFSENRITFGFRSTLQEKVRLNAGYMLRSLKNSTNSFNQISVLTLSLMFRF